MINLHISVGAGPAGPVLARPLFGDIHYIYIYIYIYINLLVSFTYSYYTCKKSPLNNDSTDISLWYWDNMVEAFAHL